ncbi:MAG TPA: ATP-binding cassette domain-containing protein, partial [Candidatus Eisenbacteria bacterium]|nr:ATP-binding cassette domain-containing protein [Candidatus Eisenbacteria bacterium]
MPTLEVLMLQVRGLVKVYPGPVAALQGVDLDIPPGMFGLLGPNGAGKTTLLRAISGLLPVNAGQVRFDGRDITNSKPEEVARLGIAHVPSGRGTMTQLTVAENLQMGAYVRRDRGGVKKDFDRVVGYFPWIG